MKKLTKRVIWMFAIGQLGWSTLSALVTNWVISFYEPNQEMLDAGQTVFLPQGRVVLGLVTILGGIYALGRLFDAVTDPWIANLSDKSRNPKGRRLPVMRRAAIPLTAATILIYWTPVNRTSPVNGVWVLVMMLLFYLFMTVYCTPYNALIAELSGSQEELTAISTAISFTFIFGSALGYACPFIWGALTPALGRVMAIRVTFIILALFALVCLLVPTFTINEFDYVDVKPVEGNAFSSLTKTFANKDFRIFVGSDICYWVAITMFQSGLTFFITSLMKLPETMNTVLYIGMTLLSVCLYVFVGKLTKKFTKKSLITFAFFEFSVVYLVTALSQGQAGTNKGMIFGVLVMILAAPAMAILGILPQTVVADIAKSDEVATGENHDGMFFAARTFAMKLGQSLAAILFTSFATIGRSSGMGYRIAALSSTVLCLAAAFLMMRYNEKRVMGLLGEKTPANKE
ncbi:MAG: MFS transporter [Lachnospiraceae bacterium]|nr:MFS transporter [Lachnospiraceae bacterium]